MFSPMKSILMHALYFAHKTTTLGRVFPTKYSLMHALYFVHKITNYLSVHVFPHEIYLDAYVTFVH